METNLLELPNVQCYSENVNDTRLNRDIADKSKILESLGGDHLIMLVLPNSHDFLTWIISIYKNGTPCALASPLWKTSTIATMLEELNTRYVITTPSKIGFYLKNGFHLLIESSHYVIVKSDKLCQNGYSPERNRTILFSSGSTGEPKAIVHKNASLIQNARMHIESIKMNRDEVVLCLLPFYYSYGFVSILLSSCLTRCTLVISGPLLHSKQLYPLIQKYQITLLPSTPFLIKRTLHTQPEDFPTVLKKMTIGGDAISKHFLSILTKHYDQSIYITFGLTEAGPRVLTGPLNPDLNIVLQPLSGVSLRLNQSQHINQGILEVKTETIMEGYVESGVLRSALDEDGYFSTGDLFQKVDEGWQFIARQRDIIVRAGEKINPQKIGDVLLSHTSVQEASVSKTLDELEEEVPFANVVLKEDISMEELMQWCRNYLTPIELPQKISVVTEILSK